MPGRVVIPIHMRKNRKKAGPRYNDPFVKKLSNSVMVIVAGLFAILVGCLLTLLGVRDRHSGNKAESGSSQTLTLIITGPVLMVVGLGVAIAGGAIYSHFFKQKKERDSKALAIRSGTFKLQNSHHMPLRDMSSAQCSSAEDIDNCLSTRNHNYGSESEAALV